MIIVDVIMVVGVHCYVAKEYICSFSYNFWFSIISSSRKPTKGVATLKALRTRSFFCWSWKFADVSRFLSFSWQYQSCESTRDADDDLYSRNSLSVPIKLIFAYAQLSSLLLEINLCNLFVQMLFFSSWLNTITRGEYLYILYHFIEIDWGELDV